MELERRGRPPTSKMQARLQPDSDLHKAIVRAVVRREPAIDFRSAQAARVDYVPDPEVLRGAALQGRILISHDFAGDGLVTKLVFQIRCQD